MKVHAVVVGPKAGQTFKYRHYQFRGGVCEIQGSGAQVEGALRSVAQVQAYRAGSDALRQARKRYVEALAKKWQQSPDKKWAKAMRKHLEGVPLEDREALDEVLEEYADEITEMQEALYDGPSEVHEAPEPDEAESVPSDIQPLEREPAKEEGGDGEDDDDPADGDPGVVSDRDREGSEPEVDAAEE